MDTPLGELANQSIDWSSWITAVATFVLAVLTAVYVILTRRLLVHQSDPCVIITVVHDEDRATMLQLVVKNIGAGLAHDVRFEFSRPVPQKAFGVTVESAKEATEMTTGPLIRGIPALGPGETRKIDWGQYGGLKVAVGDIPIIATCHFKKNGKEMAPTQCPLDITSFSGTMAAQSVSARSVKQLEKIARSLERLANDLNGIRRRLTAEQPEAINEDNKRN